MRALWLVWVSLNLAACVADTVPGADDPRNEATVREIIDQYYEDFNAGDWRAVADHFWSNAEMTTVWQAPGENDKRVVRTSIGEFFTHAPRDNPYGETFETWAIRADVKVYKELAQAWVRYGARLDESGAVAEWAGVDAFTFLKHDGTWKIAALMFASGDP